MALPPPEISGANRSKFTRRSFLRWIAACAGGLVAASYPVTIERYLVYTHVYDITLPRLPPAFEGFTIVQLTDLHYGFYMPLSVLEWVIERANRLQKDITVGTGDYVYGHDNPEQVDAVWPLLCRLRAPLGVYLVLGNHDHWAGLERALEWLEHSGFSLHHKSTRINKDDQHIWLGGAGDLWEDTVGIDELFQGAPAQDCKIILAHNPRTIDSGFQTAIDLMISGHTHGAQVDLPFVVEEYKRQYGPYVHGVYQTANGTLFVSRGIGTSIVPVRFHCAPEISVLKLHQG